MCVYGSRFKRYIARLVAAQVNKNHDEKRRNNKLQTPVKLSPNYAQHNKSIIYSNDLRKPIEI